MKIYFQFVFPSYVGEKRFSHKLKSLGHITVEFSVTGFTALLSKRVHEIILTFSRHILLRL